MLVLCIGGTMDGQLIEHEETINPIRKIQLPFAMKIPKFNQFNGPMEATITQEVYFYYALLYFPYRGIKSLKLW
jgi:hypothetical protein